MYELTKHLSLFAYPLGAAFALGLIGLLLQLFGRWRSGGVVILLALTWLWGWSMPATQSVWVPSLWHLEVANALLTAEPRGVVKEAQVIDYLQRLSRLPITADDAEVSHRQEVIIA